MSWESLQPLIHSVLTKHWHGFIQKQKKKKKAKFLKNTSCLEVSDLAGRKTLGKKKTTFKGSKIISVPRLNCRLPEKPGWLILLLSLLKSNHNYSEGKLPAPVLSADTYFAAEQKESRLHLRIDLGHAVLSLTRRMTARPRCVRAFKMSAEQTARRPPRSAAG